MNSPAYDIATILQDGAFGSIGVNIYISEDQDPDRDSIIMIRDTGTFQPDSLKQNIEWPTAQIMCREAKGAGATCADKARNIKNYLRTITKLLINGVYYVYIDQTDGPTYVGIDEIMRPLYSLNVQCARQYE